MGHEQVQGALDATPPSAPAALARTFPAKVVASSLACWPMDSCAALACSAACFACSLEDDMARTGVEMAATRRGRTESAVKGGREEMLRLVTECIREGQTAKVPSQKVQPILCPTTETGIIRAAACSAAQRWRAKSIHPPPPWAAPRHSASAGQMSRRAGAMKRWPA